MRNNRALGVDLTDLDIVVIEDSKPMQAIIRTILLGARVARVRVFDGAEEAYRSMLVEAPHIVITDWHMPGTDGLSLIRTMRNPHSGPLVSVPVILVTAHATRRLVETAVTMGIHFVLAKPLSPANVLRRVEAIVRDERSFVLDPVEGIYVLEDKETLLAGQRRRWTDVHGHNARILELATPRRGREVRPAAAAAAVAVSSASVAAAARETAEALRQRAKGLAVAIRDVPGETSTGQAAHRTA